MKENFCCSLQHCQGSKTGSSGCGCINSTIHGGINAPHNPLSQVSFAQPTVVYFDPHSTLENTTVPTANTAQVHGTPARTVDPPSFPAYHTPSRACGSTDADLLMSQIANNVNSMDPINHTPPYASFSPHTAVHSGSPGVSALPTFRGRPVNPAPILGLAPPPSGPLHGPPSGTAGHPSPSVQPPAPSGPPFYPSPPVPPPSGSSAPNQCVHFDSGGELGNCTAVHDLFRQAGYEVKVTAPNLSSEIGQAKHPHCTIADGVGVHTMLFSANLKPK